jgi:hypothetical protein
MDHAEDAKGNRIETTHSESVRWRPWPCESCGGGSTPIDFLVRGFGSSPETPEGDRNQVIDWFKKWEADRLLEWIHGCEHTQWLDMRLPWLDQGSEHLVLFDEPTSEVVKITLPGTYGDYYEIIDDKINQFDSTPAEYLLRMRWWEELFSCAGGVEEVAPAPSLRGSTVIYMKFNSLFIHLFAAVGSLFFSACKSSTVYFATPYARNIQHVPAKGGKCQVLIPGPGMVMGLAISPREKRLYLAAQTSI